MLKFFIFFFGSVYSQYIERFDVKDALTEQKVLQNIRPILDTYIADSLDRYRTDLIGICKDMISLSETQMETRLDVLSKDNGAVFTRWGRTDCPVNQTSIVYTGYAGGSFYEHTGAASDYACMPHEPVWGPHKDFSYKASDIAYMYGAEYQSPGHLFGKSTWSDDVPCAVCIGNQYTASLMIPGRIECYPGWTKAFHGNLAAGAHTHKASSQYVCVDQDPQISKGGVNENGKLFYGVKARCGSLPCPPYEEGKFLPCVVCLK
ncbi:short-chain collagen C4-like [Ylistrum balloti]|uniref:short-chain collagen C4-like n=1 Tax=Ylistrum balloti TaxID=509963 RepID=UPI0029057EBE|nr:short-chain collagen C4-like [Ylistrum balloti]